MIGESVALTRKERDLLIFLRNNAGKCLSRELLLNRVWGYREGVKSRTVDVHVQRLRRKLDPKQGARIVTIFGNGYLWSPEGNLGAAPDLVPGTGGGEDRSSPTLLFVQGSPYA